MSDHEKAIIKDGFLLTSDEPIAVGSSLWFEWLATAKKFSFKYPNGGFMAQCELRRNKSYWYAYRRRDGKLFKVYLGKTEELTFERLQQTNMELMGESAPEQTAPVPASTLNDPYLFTARIDTSFLPITKITVPVLPRQLVSRPRLNQKINTPLTLIYAPSGFGKSTLLNDWKQTCGHPVAWLTLDEHDNNPARFLYSVVTAFQTIHQDFGKNLTAYISSVPTVQAAEAAQHLTNDILEAQALFPTLGLVLDDFHRINHTVIYDAIQIWLTHFPANLYLAIS